MRTSARYNGGAALQCCECRCLVSRALIFGALVLIFSTGGGMSLEVTWEDASGEAVEARDSQDGMRPVTGVCGFAWRRARPEQLSRLNDKIWMLVDDLQRDPTDVNLYSKFETACKDNGDHNTRLRVLATIMRLADFDELRDMVALNQGYALGDRLFGHAKACRFSERERDFAAWSHMWSSGRWNDMLELGHALPVVTPRQTTAQRPSPSTSPTSAPPTSCALASPSPLRSCLPEIAAPPLTPFHWCIP